MGESRYALERRRFELQADVKHAGKYSCDARRPPGYQRNFTRRNIALAAASAIASADEGEIQDVAPLACGASAGSRGSSPTRGFSKEAPALPSGRSSSKEVPTVTRGRSSPMQNLTPRNSVAMETLALAKCRSSSREGTTAPGGFAAAPTVSLKRDRAMAMFEYSRLCGKKKVTTPTLGAFTVESEPMPLNVKHWSLGDAPLVALAASPLRGSLARLEHGRLCGNRLSNVGVEAFVGSLGPGTATIDLSENSFDHRAVEMLTLFVQRGASRLRELDLSRNTLNDRTVAALCDELLLGCPLLERLGLAEVEMGLGTRSGPALGTLVSEGARLTSLDTSGNMLQGDGGCALLRGVYTSDRHGGRLRHLDLSWNCLGQGPHHELVAGTLGSIFRDCAMLLHLDISYNNFGAEDCSLLADCLIQNHTLWGLHVEGNAAVLDADGFLHVLRDTYVETSNGSPPVCRRSRSTRGRRGGGKVVGKKAKAKVKKLKGSNNYADDVQDKRLEYALKQFRVAGACVEYQRGETYRELAMVQHAMLSTSPPKDLLELPEVLRRAKLSAARQDQDGGRTGRALSPRSQDEWLRQLSWSIHNDLRGPLFSSHGGREIHSFDPRVPRPRPMQADEEHDYPVCCWLCEGWIEVQLGMDPRNLSIAEDDAVAAEYACAFVSVDNFSRAVALQRTHDGHFTGSRFLPPTAEPLYLIFQVDDQLAVSNDLPRERLASALEVALQEARFTGQEAIGGHTQSAVVFASTWEVNVLHVAPLAEAHLLTPEAARDAAQLAAGDVPTGLATSHAPPRLLRPARRKQRVAALWTVQDSIWSSHPNILPERYEAAVAKSFERDWSIVCTKLGKTRAASDLEEARKAMLPHFSVLQDFYRLMSTVGRNEKATFGITLAGFSHILKDSGILHAHPGRSGDAFDCVYVACHRVPKELRARAPIVSTDGIVRWQFVEAVVRICEACRAAGETLGEAVVRILADHLVPLADRVRSEVQGFQQALFCQAVDKVFKDHASKLQSIFDCFSDSNDPTLPKSVSTNRGSIIRGPDNRHTMSPGEWQGLLHELGVIGERFPERVAPYSFAMGNAVHPDEASSPLHLHLSFAQFLVAVGHMLYQRVGGRNGARFLEEEARDVFTCNLDELHHRILAWKGSPLMQKIVHEGGVDLHGWSVGVPWLHQMQSVLQRLFRLGDEDMDGELSVGEFRMACQGEDVLLELAELGVEPLQVDEFFQLADRNKSGNVTVLQALAGFARIKERRINDGRAIRFLRETLSHHQFEASGNKGQLNIDDGDTEKMKKIARMATRSSFDTSQLLTREAFVEVAVDPQILAQMHRLGVIFDWMEFWDFLQHEVGGDGDKPLTLGQVLQGYFHFRDPSHMGDKAAALLRRLFHEADLDENGSLTRDEFLAVLVEPSTIGALQRMGLLEGDIGKNDSLQASLDMLFSSIDSDCSGSLEIEEVLEGFLQIRDMTRQRAFEERFLNCSAPASDRQTLRTNLSQVSAGKFCDRPRSRAAATITAGMNSHAEPRLDAAPQRPHSARAPVLHPSGLTPRLSLPSSARNPSRPPAASGSPGRL